MKLPYPFPNYSEPIDKYYAGDFVTSTFLSYQTSLLLAGVKIIT